MLHKTGRSLGTTLLHISHKDKLHVHTHYMELACLYGYSRLTTHNAHIGMYMYVHSRYMYVHCSRCKHLYGYNSRLHVHVHVHYTQCTCTTVIGTPLAGPLGPSFPITVRVTIDESLIISTTSLCLWPTTLTPFTYTCVYKGGQVEYVSYNRAQHTQCTCTNMWVQYWVGKMQCFRTLWRNSMPWVATNSTSGTSTTLFPHVYYSCSTYSNFLFLLLHKVNSWSHCTGQMHVYMYVQMYKYMCIYKQWSPTSISGNPCPTLCVYTQIQTGWYPYNNQKLGWARLDRLHVQSSKRLRPTLVASMNTHVHVTSKREASEYKHTLMILSPTKILAFSAELLGNTLSTNTGICWERVNPNPSDSLLIITVRSCHSRPELEEGNEYLSSSFSLPHYHVNINSH